MAERASCREAERCAIRRSRKRLRKFANDASATTPSIRGSAAADCSAMPAPMDSPRAKIWGADEVKDGEDLKEVADSELAPRRTPESRVVATEGGGGNVDCSRNLASSASMMARVSLRSSHPYVAMPPSLAPCARESIMTTL